MENHEVEMAKALLQRLLLFDPLAVWQPVRSMIQIARANGISKEALRLARRELGVLSITIDSEQYWGHPDRVKPPKGVQT
ncbi:hypothetical protein [Anaerotruncus massiliensis (ex Liu et al. 2021)]|uniref:hypothetical protein n=1 Tax=Anaerotruncus massiliensis (ex Liu et al. 2021) TaxID=2321404 RepID=UPI003AB6FAD6